MIEGGRVGALFFIVCFFSWRCTNQAFFLYLWKVKMADEWKDAVGKERTKGVRVHRGVLTRAGEFLPFFFSLFSLSSLYFFMEEEVNDDVVWKERLWERFQPFNFLKRSLVPREFDSLKSESSSFFFSGADQRINIAEFWHCIALYIYRLSSDCHWGVPLCFCKNACIYLAPNGRVVLILWVFRLLSGAS